MIRWKYISLIGLFLLLACQPKLTSKKVQMNNIEMLYGPISLQQLYFDYPQWQTNQNQYNPQDGIVQEVSAVNGLFQVKIFLGTWCPDSRREAPRFFNILHAADLEKQFSVKIWAVDRQLKTVKGLAKEYQIKRVPTFIFYQNGRELGRIIESPQTLYLEQDMLNILRGGKK